MILLTVGGHTQGFDRLVRAVDAFAGEFEEPVVGQIGATSYEPRNFEWFRFADQRRMLDLIAQARLLLCQGAMSALEGLEAGKPLVVFPRLRRYGEHIDDHQLEHARVLQARFPDSIRVVTDARDLREAVLAPLEAPTDVPASQAASLDGLLTALRQFLETVR